MSASNGFGPKDGKAIRNLGPTKCIKIRPKLRAPAWASNPSSPAWIIVATIAMENYRARLNRMFLIESQGPYKPK